VAKYQQELICCTEDEDEQMAFKARLEMIYFGEDSTPVFSHDTIDQLCVLMLRLMRTDPEERIPAKKALEQLRIIEEASQEEPPEDKDT